MKSLGKPILKIYESLGSIFDHKEWTPSHHKLVPKKDLISLWEKIIPIVAMNVGLPEKDRFMSKDIFVEQMRGFLYHCHQIKKENPITPM